MLVSERTPKAFIWHTAADGSVSVLNSYEYASSLKKHNIDAEMHIFPHGVHGLGVCKGDFVDDEKILEHNAQWTNLLLNWLRYIGF